MRVDGLGVAAASSLRERFAGDFETRADTASAIPWVEIATEGPVSDLLHRLEEWTTASGLPSICVNLDGRAYILEAAGPRVTRQDQLLAAAKPS